MRMLLLLFLLLLIRASLSCGSNISYDHRAIIIDGQRRILISGCIHYPRATPLMWPGLISKAKEGGLDMIDTYVFWDGHEPSPGVFNFEGRYDLIRFLKLVQEAGLYVSLRIGPYVCAEWNFGGFPAWLLKVPGIKFRTNNKPFKDQMERFVKKIVSLVKTENMFASQGGPILFSQIENEYGNIQGSYGQDGKKYILWAASMAKSLDTGVPWIMCQQSDAPEYIINTCNGYYCDGWKPNSGHKPRIWSENWSGWFQSWGEAVPHRPVEDVAFAVARFFQRGGIVQNYYMYFGGTNFGRTSGGPYITTSYDYDAPLDEYGLVRQPKWGHLKELHSALKLCEAALTSGDPRYYSLGRSQEAHVYMNGNLSCAAFLANIDMFAASVNFNGRVYSLPPWSVSILPDCITVVFNTAQVSVQFSDIKMKLRESNALAQTFQDGLKWEWNQEPVGVSGNNIVSATQLYEQLKLSNDSTDYMWYSTSLQLSEADLLGAKPLLSITKMRDMVYVFINGKLAGMICSMLLVIVIICVFCFQGTASTLHSPGLYANVKISIQLKAGENELAILSTTVGLQNYGDHMETHGAGINGQVQLQGLATGVKDLTSSLWLHQVGLKGVHNDSIWFSSAKLPIYQPLVWYKTAFDTPAGNDPVTIFLASMSKGQAWVNGHSLGRFWPAIRAPLSGCSQKCDYRGSYSSSKCLTGCGDASQNWYHVPREWLNEKSKNTLVLFEELGGNVSEVAFATRELDRVCGVVSEYSLPPVYSTSTLPELILSCNSGQLMTSISFSSFGTPQGSCGKFEKGKCHAESSAAIVDKACLGKKTCSILVSLNNFGDPCPGKTKALAVEASCSSAEHLSWSATF